MSCVNKYLMKFSVGKNKFSQKEQLRFLLRHFVMAKDKIYSELKWVRLS